MISRRDFLKAITAGIAIYPYRNVIASEKKERILNLYNIHTEESLNIQYYYLGRYDINALAEINHFLRCHYTNEVMTMDVELIDLLCDIKDKIGFNREVVIISGYRSRLYNEYLRSIGRKVGVRSLHLIGCAIDFTIPGMSTKEIASIAKSFGKGGVGVYTDFVHIDTGRIRYW